ncbi:iron chelate uptake ABC transporter family permease subunit, partial [Staphylococcus hominis]
IMMLCIVLLGLLLPKVKLLQVGTLKARSLSLNVRQMMFMVLTLSSIMTAIIVSYTGIIGFIGMIVPQLIRRTTQTTLG